MFDAQSTAGPDGNPVSPGKLHVTLYDRGAIIKGWAYDGPTGGGKRGKVRAMSDQSRYRLGWMLDNAAVKWGATTLLTFQRQPKDPKAALERFTRKVRAGAPGLPYAWWMETQARGVTHFHFVWGKEWLEVRGWLDETHLRVTCTDGTPREYLRGPLDDLCVRAWVSSVNRISVLAQRFAAQGTTEPVRDHSRIAWYAASEACKRTQKQLPRGSDGCGNWWFVCPAARPVARGAGHLLDYPFERPLGRIFDAGMLDVRPGIGDPEGLV